MALYADDPLPKNLTVSDAYASVRAWYQNHPDPNGPWASRPCDPKHAKISISLINALPPAKELTDIEMIAVLREVLFGHLEWGFHQCDGRFKMAAYAAGYFSYTFTTKDKAQLQNSILRPYLSPSAKR